MKRLLAILLCLVLAAGLFPASAGAAGLPAETPDLPLGGIRPLPVQDNALDKGGLMIDVSTFDFDLYLLSDVAFNSLIEMILNGDIGYYKNGSVEYLDVDRDGVYDLKTYKNDNDTYLTATSNPSVQGFYRVDMSQSLVAEFESEGHEYCSYVLFAFAAPDKDYGSYTIDMSRDSHYDLVYHLSAAGKSVIDTVSFLTQRGRFNAVLNEYNELSTDLDRDGHYDLTWNAAADGFAMFEMNSDTNLEGEYKVTLTSAEIAAANAAGLAGYCTTLIFKFPSPDLGSYTIDLRYGNFTLNRFTPKGQAAHDSIIFASKRGKFQSFQSSGNNNELDIDLDKDNNVDLVMTCGVDGFDLFTKAQYPKSGGDIVVTFNQSDLDAIAEENFDTYYSTLIFRLPSCDRGTVFVDLKNNGALSGPETPEDLIIKDTMLFAGEIGKVNCTTNGDKVSIDLDMDGRYDVVMTVFPNGHCSFAAAEETGIGGDYKFQYNDEDKAAANESRLPRYYSTVVFKFPPRDYGEFVIDLSESSSFTLNRLTNAGQAAHDTILYLFTHGRIDFQMGETNMDGYLDLDKDKEGRNDVHFTTGVDGFNVYERTSEHSTWGTWRFTLSSAEIAAIKAEGGPGYYSIVTFEFPVWKNPFYDVERGKFYYDAVLWAFNWTPQITEGTDEHHFSPDNSCTRGQVVTFLWRSRGCPTPTITTHPFKDVKPGAYYYTAMLWAVENGITTGVDETHFGPNKPCTRKQIVTFIWRTAGSSEPQNTNCPFTDVNPKASYYKAMLWAVENGITTGTSKTKFSPDDVCTRGQVVTFLYRAFGPAG